MHEPPALKLQFRRSRLGAAFIIVAYAMTTALLLSMPWPFALRIAAPVFVMLAAAMALRNVIGSPSPSLIRIGIDRNILVTTRSGRTYHGQVLAGSYVGGWLTTIVWRTPGARIKRSVLVLPDSLRSDDFRQLRVMLRYSRAFDALEPRSDVTAHS